MLQEFENFVTGITVCYKFIQRIKTLEMTEFDLRGTHAMCMYFLQRHPEGLTASQLAQMCAEDKGAISRTLAVLQEKGLISSGEKKYRTPLYLTEEGKRIADILDDLVVRWVIFGGANVTDEERAVFYKTLGQISHNLGAKLESCEALKEKEN